MQRPLAAACAALLAATVVSCAQQPPPGPIEVRQGKIEQITPTQIESDHHTGLGAVIGGVAGAGLGSLMGGGTGHDVMIALGAIGGAVGGAEVAKHYDKPVAGQQIVVRLHSGVLVVVTQPADANLYVGEQVYVEGQGTAARVVRDSAN